MKTIVLADVSSLYYCVAKKWAGRRLDYQKLMSELLVRFPDMFRSVAYGTQKENELSGFISALKGIGYETKFKKWRNSRTSWNVGIAMDMVRLSNAADTFVLCSSDPDLAEALLWARDNGIRCVVASVGISRALRDVAAECIELGEELLEECEESVSSSS